MKSVARLVRRFLAQRHYTLTREEPEIPPTLAESLRRLTPAGTARWSAICLDNDVGTQTDLLELLGTDRVELNCPVIEPNLGTLAPGARLPARPTGPFVAVVDLELTRPAWITSHLPWLWQADVLVAGLRLGSGWTGNQDILEIEAQLRSEGLCLRDVALGRRFPVLQSPAGRVFLVFVPNDVTAAKTNASRFRVNEARSYLTTPILTRNDSRVLTSTGSYGFSGGVFNPGAVEQKGTIHLLARAEHTPWQVHRQSARLFFSCTEPWSMSLGDDGGVTSAVAVSMVGMPDPRHHRIEDFRLFRHRHEIYCNHAVASLARPAASIDQPIVTSELRTRIGISRFDVDEQRLTWCGMPTIDRPLQATEKNWAMFADDDGVCLIYSFSPYVLLRGGPECSWSFQTVVSRELSLPFGDDGLSVRNSVNPVPYDDRHLLHVVHQVYPNKQYVFRAVLIERSSCLPVRISRRPLAGGGRSQAAAIHYISAVIAGPTVVHFFAGIDDAGTVMTSIPRDRLDREWIEL